VEVEGKAAPATFNSSQGAQAGDGNVQVNVFPGDRRPDVIALDAASLEALSPHTALWRIRAMQYDDVVLVLAKAKVRAAANVLALLLRADERLAVSLLADINRGKAQALIAALPGDWSASGWLGQLPAAAEAIGSCAVEMQWAGTGDAGRLERTTESAEGAHGFRRSYRGDWVYWSPEFGAQPVTGVIAEYYEGKGGPGKLGLPHSPEAGGRSPYGTSGVTQNFTFAIIFSSGFGVFAVAGNLLTPWVSGKADDARLGFPVSDETSASDVVDGLSMQRFEGGAIFSGASGTFAVRPAVLDYLDATDQLYPGSAYYPVAHETDAEVSPGGTMGRMQKFAGSHERDYAQVIYISDKHGVHGVFGPTMDHHARLGGTSSWLGFPTNEWNDLPLTDNVCGQEFEGGTVFWGSHSTDETPIAVPVATMDLISADDDIRERLGLPVSEDESIGTGDSSRVQFFENGNVTVRDGKREIWLRR
jgi:hypothetical protein